MRTRTFRICFLHLVKSPHLVECLVLGRQVLEVLRGLDHHQLVAHLVLAMDQATIMEQEGLDLATEVLVILVALVTMAPNVANMQVLVVLGILEVDNMVVTLEVNFRQVLKTRGIPLVQGAIRLVVLEVHRRAIHPPAILLGAPLGERRLVLIQDQEGVQEHHPPLSAQGLHLQDPTPHQVRLRLTRRQPHHPQHPLHPRQPPLPPFLPLPIHLLLRLRSQDLRVPPPHTLGQQAHHHPTTHRQTPRTALVPLLPVDQAQVVLGAQDKDSLVVILVGALHLLAATQVILEDRVTLRQAILEAAVLRERPDLATLVVGLILHLKGATLHTAIPREDLEVIHPQVQGIPTDLQAVRWVPLEVMLLGQEVPHPPKELGVQLSVHIWNKRCESPRSIQF